LGLSEKVIIKHDVNREVIMETVQQQSAKIIVGSSLLLASLGLLFMARPAFARTTLPLSTSTTSFVDENESKGILNRNLETGTREVGPSQSESAEKEKEEDPAELVLQAILDRYPDDLKSLEGLMYVRLRKGDVGKALEVIDKLLALKPDHAPWQLIRAQSLDFVGNSDQARQAFEAILAKDPLSARALQVLLVSLLIQMRKGCQIYHNGR
jgi:Flp pilus assembly protein TadD